jgi:hypothetical protein
MYSGFVRDQRIGETGRLIIALNTPIQPLQPRSMYVFINAVGSIKAAQEQGSTLTLSVGVLPYLPQTCFCF